MTNQINLREQIFRTTFDPVGATSLIRSDYYRLKRPLPGWFQTSWVTSPFHSTQKMLASLHPAPN